eukprot:4379472-Prymnesium_polylepis.1
MLNDSQPAILADTRQRRHERGAGVVAGAVRLQRRLGEVCPMRLDDFKVGPQARKRVVPILLRIVACDTNVEHVKITAL